MEPLAPRPHGHPRARLAALLAALAVAAPVAIVQPAAAAPATRTPPPAAATLPPDFPSDVPLPPGELQSATGGGGQWSVLLLVGGSAADAHGATVAFYTAHGFVAETDSILHDATHRVTIVVENRDHSPNATFLAIGVGPRQAAPAGGRVALATRLSGHGRGSATVTLDGARVCWTIRNLRGVGRPRSATIRQGTAGRSGPVMVRLGRRYRASGCTAIPAALGASIAARPGGFYVSVATRARPAGAVRGQLRHA
jgi:hypothetical protein